MTIDTHLVKNLLRTYDKQLSSSQRLARYRQSFTPPEVRDQVSISREAKRRQMVERVAGEIVDNLMVTGSQSQVVTEIRQKLEAELEARLLFCYSPDKGRVEIHRQTRQGSEMVSEQESREIMERLWQITLTKVDRTML